MLIDRGGGVFRLRRRDVYMMDRIYTSELFYIMVVVESYIIQTPCESPILWSFRDKTIWKDSAEGHLFFKPVMLNKVKHLEV